MFEWFLGRREARVHRRRMRRAAALMADPAVRGRLPRASIHIPSAEGVSLPVRPEEVG